MPPRTTRTTASRADTPVIGLHERALDNVAFMRGVMERSAHFTAVPGWGGVWMGLSAIVAAVIASRQPTPRTWANIWMIEAAVGLCIALGATAIKARRTGVPLGAGPARRFALCLLPALVAGAALTAAAQQTHSYAMLPMVWLLLYGTGVCAAGSVSSPAVVSLLGIGLIVGGVAASISPVTWSNWYMGVFFGVGHMAAGAVIIRKYGG